MPTCEACKQLIDQPPKLPPHAALKDDGIVYSHGLGGEIVDMEYFICTAPDCEYVPCGCE